MRELIAVAFGIAAGFVAISLGAGVLVVGIVGFVVTFVLLGAMS